MANIVKHKRGSGNDPSASDLVLGELAIRTDNGKLFTKMDSGAIAEIAGGGSDIAINTLSSSSATGGGSATFNGSAYRFTLSSPPSVSAQQLLVSIAGVIQKPVAGSGQPSEGFSINGNDIILAQAPATGTDFFILTFRSLGVSEPADNTVTSAKIVDGAIVNADINASANITGTKISPNFGSQNIVSTGYVSVKDLYLTDDSPTVFFTDTNNTDYIIEVNSGIWKVRDTTNSADRLVINSSGNVGIGTNAPTSSLSIVDSDPELAFVYTGTAGGHATKLKFLDFRGFVNAQIANNLKNDGVGTGAARLDFFTATGGTLYNRLRITDDGKVGINETSPDAKLQISDGSNPDIGLKYTGTASGHNTRLMFIDKRGVINAQIANSLKDDGVGTAAADLELATSTGGTLATRMLINRYGNVGIGNANPAAHLHLDGGTGGAQQLRVHNHSSIGNFSGNYGSEFRHASSATMHAMLIHAHEANDARRTLDISDFNGIFTTFVNGKVGIGTTSPSAKLHVNSGKLRVDGGSTARTIDVETTHSSGGEIASFQNNANNAYGGLVISGGEIDRECRLEAAWGNGFLTFWADNGERMRITNNGKIRIGSSLNTDAAGKFQVIEESGGNQANDCNAYFETNANDWNIKTYYNSSGTHYHMAFIEQGSFRGRIQGNDGSNVQYLAGSDYRWKENIVDLSGSEGIDICKKLKPRKYNWIENREETGQINTVDGFIAHEVEEAGVLGAVTGKKDAVNEDGSIDGQMLDYGQMTPVLAAAIKGLISKVEVLETKVTALGG